MKTQGWLTTREIAEIFANEISAAGGKVIDTFDDGERLFLRAVLAGEREVKAKDRVQGGVALRATEEEIWISPYIFRQVCSNGAIRAHALQSQHFCRLDFASRDEPRRVYEMVEAIRACCQEAAFAESTHEMRTAQDLRVDISLTIMPLLMRLPQNERNGALVREILHRFSAGRDLSRFGLMNAVTSVARDQRDPDERWRLEEIGGAVPVVVEEPPREPVRVLEKVLLGA
jgi:hypothetical protein